MVRKLLDHRFILRSNSLRNKKRQREKSVLHVALGLDGMVLQRVGHIAWVPVDPWIPSGKLTVCYWKWPFIVDFPIKNGDFPFKLPLDNVWWPGPEHAPESWIFWWAAAKSWVNSACAQCYVKKNGRPGRRCSLAIGYGLASKKASDNAELPARAWRAAESPISFSK